MAEVTAFLVAAIRWVGEGRGLEGRWMGFEWCDVNGGCGLKGRWVWFGWEGVAGECGLDWKV